jgi:hypothetical protein
MEPGAGLIRYAHGIIDRHSSQSRPATVDHSVVGPIGHLPLYWLGDDLQLPLER